MKRLATEWNALPEAKKAPSISAPYALKALPSRSLNMDWFEGRTSSALAFVSLAAILYILSETMAANNMVN